MQTVLACKNCPCYHSYWQVDRACRDSKSITIWFQNRRQTARRKSSRASDVGEGLLQADVPGKPSAVPKAEAKDAKRPALVTIAQVDSSCRPIASVDHNMVCQAPLPLDAVGSDGLSLEQSAMMTSVSPAINQALSGTPSNDRDKSDAQNMRRKKHDLDWACEHASKRRRTGEPDAPEKLDTDLDPKNNDGTYRLAQTELKDEIILDGISAQYRDALPPDIVLGISLLFGFKYSGDVTSR